ncbi:MAG: hypothetical protein M1482_05170, partial [Chloroflexi bacterium]|nr:hypothetical protein [Chloroflexota bacterium]
MRVHVKFFAIFRERVGIKTEWTEVPDGTTVESPCHGSRYDLHDGAVTLGQASEPELSFDVR